MGFLIVPLSSPQRLCLWMAIHLVATQLVKLLKKVQKSKPTGTNEIKNQNTSSTLAEARSLCTYTKFKEFKRLLHIFPSFCINCLLHHTVPSYPSKTWTLVSACFLERCLSGMEKKLVFPWLLPVWSLLNAEIRSGNSTTVQLPSAILESSMSTKQWDITSTAHVRPQQRSPKCLAGSSQLQLIST